MITIALADDQALVRTGFRMIIEAEQDMRVTGEAADGAEAVALAERTTPDVVLMDVRMPGTDGIEATRRITASDHTDARVIILTTFDLDEYVVEALRAGASGFLLKDVPPEGLIDAIRIVAAGDALIAPAVTRRLLDRFAARLPSAGDDDRPAALSALTDRETDVLRMVARGLSNAEIAAELVLGETTVKTHVSHLLMKLQLRDRVQAVVFAYESGLIRPGD